MAKEIALYTTPDAMEPLFPASGKVELEELSLQIVQESGNLFGAVSSPIVREKVTDLLREMNSYYSNLIEGHKTLPREIERAMRADVIERRSQSENQLLSVAHIRTQQEMERRLQAAQGKETINPFDPDFVCWIHREFYQCLPPSMHWAQTKSGERYPIVPGKVRDYMVSVGAHDPPAPEAVGRFLKRFGEFYSDPQVITPARRLVAIAAAHQRLAWIHPFGDGNGRVTRLHSQAALMQCRLAEGITLQGVGLWTISRGLARQRAEYYHYLQGADRRREGDYDGRGNLSDRGLQEFCRFFLTVMLDQIRFMGELMGWPTFKLRIERYFQFIELGIKHREEIARLVTELALCGEMERSRVPLVIGKKESTARSVVQLAIEQELIESVSERGRLRIRFPAKVLDHYFPKLFLDIPVA